MKVKFIRSWQVYKPGQELEIADGMANVLIKRGIIVRVEVEKSKGKRKEYMVPPQAAHA